MARPKVDGAGMFVEPAEDLRPADALSGRYQLLGRLGAGGMAELFLARLSGLEGFEKFVVVKRILAARATDPDFIRMFEDEARVAATLAHPNIVTTHDIGRDGDDVFFTMEYLHGQTVRHLLAATKRAQQAFPIDLALQIAIGCAAGLDYAHEHCDYRGEPLGIVHRDVSPSNVIVTYQSGVKLIDFGIAKAASGKHVTDAGVVKGKAAYMSPEQCKGGAIDRRSDVFCLGIVLYEMITGQRPFDGEHVLAIMANVVQATTVVPSSLRPGIPRELDAIVMRALAKDPADRFVSAFAMQEALELFTRQYRLHALPGALGRYLEHLFGAKPYPWTQSALRSAAPPPMPGAALTTPRQRIDEAIPVSDAAIEIITSTASAPSNPSATPSGDASAAASIGSQSGVTSPSQAPARRPWGWIAFGSASAASAVILAVGLARDRPTRATVPNVDAAATTAAAAGPPAASQGAPPTVGHADEPRPPAPASPPVATPPVPDAVPRETGDDEVVDIVTPPPTEATAQPSPTDLRKQRRQQAQRALDRAQSLAYRDPPAAMAAVRQSIELAPTQGAYSLMGVIACRTSDSKSAQRAYAQLSGARQTELANVCAGRGIKLTP